MPSITMPITSNIKMKNSCRRILTRNAQTPPPPPLAGTIETELKVKLNVYLLYWHFFLERKFKKK